jgi:hypothetical protein
VISHVLIHEIGHHFGLVRRGHGSDRGRSVAGETMLDLRPNSNVAALTSRLIPADALICTFECTFCVVCAAEVFAGDLPKLRRRPCATADPTRRYACQVPGLRPASAPGA